MKKKGNFLKSNYLWEENVSTLLEIGKWQKQKRKINKFLKNNKLNGEKNAE